MQLSKQTVILAAIAVFTILAVQAITTGRGGSVLPLSPSSSPSPLYKTQTNEGGNVTVDVTPETLATGKPVTFQIVFDTHSVDLDFDVAAAAEIGDEKGNTYGVAVWKGDPPGGHHRKGVLTFPTPLKQTSSSSLILKDIAGVNERTFVWKL